MKRWSQLWVALTRILELQTFATAGAQQEQGGHGPTPPSASPPPPPLGSLTAPRPVQRERKRSPEGKGAGRPASIQSVARLSSPASESAPGLGAPPGAPPAPRTPLIAHFHTFCMARRNIWVVLILCTSCGLLLGDCKSEIW
ncbi:uncharacterized protein LOC126043890 [Accipiter gentilis]|uniref:uncharacterized protein LOC126043890 n=1 Tax=Astur gentilis TaxID=8957 RepID=UPI00210F2FAA|nr:uncharacterized protein LOC126043890 [Accipiter gentilis]